MTELQVWLLIAVQLVTLVGGLAGLALFEWRVARWVGEVTHGLATTRQDVLELKAGQETQRRETRENFQRVHDRVDDLHGFMAAGAGGIPRKLQS